MEDDSFSECSFIYDKGNMIINQSSDLSEFLKQCAANCNMVRDDCLNINHSIERFYIDQRNSIKSLLNKVSTIQEALSSATVDTFYSIMVNEVKQAQSKEMNDLKTKIEKLEREKVEHEQNTNKVIEQLTLLNFEKDDQLQTMTSDITLMSNSLSTQSDEN